MPGRELAVVNVGLHRIGEFEQPQCIGDVAAAFADDLGDLFLAVAELIHQRAVSVRLFQRIKVGALHVLDDRKLQRFGVGCLDDDDWDLMQSGALRGAPAAFAGDDLVAVGNTAQRPHHDRLNDAALTQGGGELVKLGVGECAPRVVRIRPQRAGRQPPLAARTLARAFLANVTDQRGESASQSRPSPLPRHRGVS